MRKKHLSLAIALRAYLAFHTWEILDVWLVPPRQNRESRANQTKEGESKTDWSPFIAPTDSRSLAAGLQLRL